MRETNDTFLCACKMLGVQTEQERLVQTSAKAYLVQTQTLDLRDFPNLTETSMSKDSFVIKVS